MPVRAIRLFSEAVRDFLRAWPRLLAADLVYKIIAFVVLYPLLGVALQLFMSTSGKSVLADEDILFFFLSPIGLTALVVFGAVSIAIVTLEQACLMAIGFGEARAFYVRATGALRFAARKAWPIARLAIRIFIRVLLIALPFLGVCGLVYLLLLQEHDINFYLAERPAIFLFASGIVAVLLATMAVLIIRRLLRWAFSLPLLLFEGLAPARALKISEERTRSHKWLITVILVAWGIASALLSGLPLAAVGGAARWLVPKAASSMNLLVVVMGGFLLLWGLLSLMVTMVNASMFALLTVGLFDRVGSSPEATLARGAVSERSVEGRRGRFSIKWLLAGLVAAGIVAAVVGHVFVDRVRLDDDVVVIAHRGAAGSAPENTLASIELAVEKGTDFVEIDVLESADGKIVVVHDSDLMRVGGSPLKISQATYAQLLGVDVGRWFGPEFSGQRVPTLEQVLEVCRGRARVNIELKTYGHNVRLEERVAEIVEQAGMEDEIVLMSLSSDIVRSMKELRPGWTVGLLTAKALGNLTRSEADFLAVHVGIASPRFIRQAHAAGKEVYVWTVNDRLNMSRMMSRGVDGVITDYPEIARQVIERRAALSSAERLMVSAAFFIGLEPKDPPPEADIG
jgi:glycerophosphoryl diester phosphodiesterase